MSRRVPTTNAFHKEYTLMRLMCLLMLSGIMAPGFAGMQQWRRPAIIHARNARRSDIYHRLAGRDENDSGGDE